LSRQTSLPGAMAYAAPEVLTGKYNEKIDIFSFGVLVTQMGCGEYPRIESRAEQKSMCISHHPCLKTLVNDMMEYSPSDRPSATTVYSTLTAISNNDRFYPPARRQGPQRDVGLLARRWMTNEITRNTKVFTVQITVSGVLMSN
jgi:serine/threonine protein kinase